MRGKQGWEKTTMSWGPGREKRREGPDFQNMSYRGRGKKNPSYRVMEAKR